MCNKEIYVAHMTVKPHSSIAVAAYSDLMRLLLDDAASEITGSIERRTRGGRTYLYERLRRGTKSYARYLGEATDELEARLRQAEELRQRAAARRAEQTRLVRVLRAEGFGRLDAEAGQILTAFARAGVFRLGGTLVGTVAFKAYEGELGARLGFDAMAQTGDIDLASFERLSIALGDHVTEQLGATLAEFDFDAVPSLAKGKTWRWRHASHPVEIEFLTPAFGDEGIRDLPALGVSAQSLHHLNFVLSRPIKAVLLYRSGVLVQVPRPEAFAVHKLIVADRRQGGPDQAKSRKDRAQAAFLVEVLAEDRPAELVEAFDDAVSRGPKWRQRIEASLRRMPQTRELIEAARSEA